MKREISGGRAASWKWEKMRMEEKLYMEGEKGTVVRGKELKMGEKGEWYTKVQKKRIERESATGWKWQIQ